MKAARISLLICLLAPVCAQATDQNKSDTNGYQAPPSLPAPSTAKVESSTDPLQKESEPQKSKDDTQVLTLITPAKTVWDWLAFWANITLATVGIFGMWVATKSLRHIRKQSVETARQRVALQQTLDVIKRQADQMEAQTDIARKVAAATQASFEAFVEKERARFRIVYTFTPQCDLVTFEVVNIGATVARIGGSFIEKLVFPSIKDMPQEPTLLWVKTPDKITYLGPGERDLVDAALIKPEKDGETVWFYGFVRYVHAFTEREYDFRFCFQLYWLGKKPHLTEGGPSLYLGEYPAPSKESPNTD